MDLAYEYEREGYELASGRYLPDFWLPSLKCWVEIKHTFEEGMGISGICDKAEELAKATDAPVYIFFGLIQYPLDSDAFDSVGVTPDGKMALSVWWACCAICNKISLSYHGNSAGACACRPHILAWPGYKHERLYDAAEAARAARFEHGERG
jgi:hypothetical protein